MKIIPPLKPRNRVLDILRGHYLIAMLFGHLSYYIGNSLFTFYEGNSSLWVSPAEGFIFLSGFFVTYTSYKRLVSNGFWLTLKSFWRKAFWMYVLGVVLTLVYTTVANYLGKGPNVSGGLKVFDSYTLIVNTLTYRYNYSWADIIMMYVPFMVIAPIVLQAFKAKLTYPILVLSFLVWATNFAKTSCSIFCVSFFEVTSWQFLFILGMFVAFKRHEFRRVFNYVKTNSITKILVLFLFILSVVASVYGKFFGGYSGQFQSLIEVLFNKENIAAGRILVFGLWLSVYYYFIEKYFNKIPSTINYVYEEFGKNSLTTYVIQSIVLFTFYYLHLKYSFWVNNLYQIFVLSLVILLLVSFKKIQNRVKSGLK